MNDKEKEAIIIELAGISNDLSAVARRINDNVYPIDHSQTPPQIKKAVFDVGGMVESYREQLIKELYG